MHGGENYYSGAIAKCTRKAMTKSTVGGLPAGAPSEGCLSLCSFSIIWTGLSPTATFLLTANPTQHCQRTPLNIQSSKNRTEQNRTEQNRTEQKFNSSSCSSLQKKTEQNVCMENAVIVVHAVPSKAAPSAPSLKIVFPCTFWFAARSCASSWSAPSSFYVAMMLS